MKKITIATRGSALALWQAEHIKHRLLHMRPDIPVDLLVLKTKGDVILDVPLAKVGGKGLFVKEIEEALLAGEADLAVHSMKDVPMLLPQGLILAAVPQREDCWDMFLSETAPSLRALPQGAVLGTSSLRRQAQVLAERPDLRVTMLRGNVETRLRKMQEGQYDAIILAAAGLKRLGLAASQQEALRPPRFLPAAGQGALGIEMREDREELLDLVATLNDPCTRICVEAERALLTRLEGGCQVPIGAWARLENHCLRLEGLVARPDGSLVLRRGVEVSGVSPAALEDPAQWATLLAAVQAESAALACALLDAGAQDILQTLYTDSGEGQA